MKMRRMRYDVHPAITASMLSIPIGSEGLLEVDALRVRVRVLDSRSVFGRVDYLVTPVAGEGTQWVTADRVKLEG